MNRPQGLSLGSVQHWVKEELGHTGWKASVSDEATKHAMEWCKTGMLEGVGPVNHKKSCIKYIKNNYQNPVGFLGFILPFIISGIISIIAQLILAWLLNDDESRKIITAGDQEE